MSDAFTQAAADLYADPSLSIPATYRKGGHGPGVTVRIIRVLASRLEIPGASPIRARGNKISVLAADGMPAKNDSWTLEDGTVLVAQDAERSVEGATYTVTVR